MARALDLHSRGQGFDSLILHEKRRKTEVGSPKKMLQNEMKAWKGKTFTEITEQEIRLVA